MSFKGIRVHNSALEVKFASRKYSKQAVGQVGQLGQLAHISWKSFFAFVFSDKFQDATQFIPRNEVRIWIVGIVPVELWAVQGRDEQSSWGRSVYAALQRSSFPHVVYRLPSFWTQEQVRDHSERIGTGPGRRR